MKTIKIKTRKREYGQEDVYFVNEEDTIIATLFKNADRKGYQLFFHVPELSEVIIDAGTLMEASSKVEKKLVEAGYIITNPHFHTK
jgi:transcriptional regulator